MNIEMLDSKEYELENGIKIISIKKNTKIATVQLGINVGPINEKINEKGMSHFIEHMIFKGTKKRTNEEINQDLEDRAGSYNAYTTYTSTVFGITALKEELESSIDIISDIIIKSILPEEEIEKEKTVILAEIRNGLDDVEHLSYTKANEYAFEKSHLRYDIAGSEENINSFTRESLMNFYKGYYLPNNCVISIVSSYDHEEIRNMAEKYFNDWERREILKTNIIEEKNIEIEKTTYKKDIEQNTITYLYTFYGLNRNQELALEILNYKLGESANSILFRELREKRGMAYDVYSDIDGTEYIKTLYIYTSIGEDDVKEARETIDSIINNILSKNINIDEKNIILMKKVMRTGIISMIEDIESLCNYALHQKLSGKQIDAFLDDLERLNYIDGDMIYDVAKSVLSNPTIHILLSK
ncbi:putative zinc-dependent protease [Gottschalkia acidurici 9a]|uniref:Zinc-dependent protease n=1 Tax=Gottschalkia acidurici (strain ATCC 7906 / DSM 604 / BCRC 14475 / CIP 104303 / KCTC 5404 / NCIMB 10678 / 9a) TaxID=1128398 RepID=K0AZP5_GOTA9|nr:pitrilysin family protein [Gottschalkia acidurici]AFS78190.1 putative zinc-dependent protease [Gottschalkia acidurici 9a]